MSFNRLSELLGDRRQAATLAPSGCIRGFTNNPLGAQLTPAQALMYELAYQQALQARSEQRPPVTSWWN